MKVAARADVEISESPEGVRVVMAVPRPGCVVAFLGAWLLGWLAGEIVAVRSVLGALSNLDISTLFLVAWLVGWTIAGVAFGGLFLLMLDGREIVTVDGEALHRRVEAFGRGLTWDYTLADVGDLRPTANDPGQPREFVSFEYKARTVRFGSGLNETQARQVAEAIWRRFPRLRPADEAQAG